MDGMGMEATEAMDIEVMDIEATKAIMDTKAIKAMDMEATKTMAMEGMATKALNV